MAHSIPVAVAVEEDDAAIGEEVEPPPIQRYVVGPVADDLLYRAIPNILKGFKQGFENQGPIRFAKIPIIGPPGTISSVFLSSRVYGNPDDKAFYTKPMMFLPTDMYKLFLILSDDSKFSSQQLVVVIKRTFKAYGEQYYSMGFVPVKDNTEKRFVFTLSSPHEKFTTVADMNLQESYALHDFERLGSRAVALNDIVSDYDICLKKSSETNTPVYALNSYQPTYYGLEYNSLTGFKTVFKIPRQRLRPFRNVFSMIVTGKMKKKNKKNNKTQKKRIK